MSSLSLSGLSQIDFIKADQLQPPPGLPTGIPKLDQFLLWQGLPLGELSLLQGSPGTGATSLWLNTLKDIHQSNKWAAWVNSDAQLFPAHVQKLGLNLKKLLVAKEPQTPTQLYWLLQELISSSLFEVVACQVSEFSLKNHQLQKLKRLCRMHKVALVFINHKTLNFSNPLFSLIINFQKNSLTIARALHRPTPHKISGILNHANFVYQLQDASRVLLR